MKKPKKIEKHKDRIPPGGLGFFENRLRRFMGELKAMVGDPAPHDREKQRREAREIQAMESSITDFFNKAKGESLLVTAGTHCLLINGESSEKRRALQWEDHGGVLTGIRNPPIALEGSLKDVEGKIVLSGKGEIRGGRDLETP